MPDLPPDPRLLTPKPVARKEGGLEMLDRLLQGLAVTSPILPRTQPNKMSPDGLNFGQPRIEQLLNANKSRYGGRGPGK